MAGSSVESLRDVEKQLPDSTPDQNRHSNVGNCNQVSGAEKGTVSYIAKKVLICLFDITISFYLRFALVCITGKADYINESLDDLWRCGRRERGKVGSDAKEGSQGEEGKGPEMASHPQEGSQGEEGKGPEMASHPQEGSQGEESKGPEMASHPDQEGSQMYRPKKVAEARAKKLRDKGLVLATRLGFLAVLWLVINLSVPSLKTATLMDSSLWKWSLLLAVVFIGFPFKHFVIKMLLDLADVTGKFKGSDTQYWIEGLKASARPVIYCTCSLTLWIIFFFTNRDELSSKYRTVHEYIISTLVTALAAAFLWLVKSALTLYWKAKRIYYRPHYKEKILAAGFEFYFLLLLFGQKTPPPELIPDKVIEKILSTENPGKAKDNDTPENPDDGMTVSRRIERYFSKTPVGLQDVDEVAICLTERFELPLTEDNDTPDIDPKMLKRALAEFMKIAGPDNPPPEESQKSRNAALLLKVLPNLRERSANPHDDRREWLEDAHKYCYLLTHKIDGDLERTDILNRVLIGFILVFVGLLWLFITELATTSLIVTMGSLFLGLSFAFGDTCKTFFQGFMFTFVTHPLDVGDRCSIDENKEGGDRILEVKRIKLLTTTFYEINVEGKRTNVLTYPNSELATKCIIKLPAQPKAEAPH